MFLAMLENLRSVLLSTGSALLVGGLFLISSSSSSKAVVSGDAVVLIALGFIEIWLTFLVTFFIKREENARSDRE